MKFIRFLLFCAIVNPIVCTAAMFERLEDLNTYAKKHTPDPKIDNDDWLNPDFTSYYHKQLPSFFSRILHHLRIKRLPWSFGEFRKLLANVTQARRSKGLYGRFVVAFAPKPTEHIYLWGSLRGAFHSLVRGLDELKRCGEIDNNLKVKPGTYLIFQGDVINQSAYILETLTVILRLMEKNPQQVFYIRGHLEDFQHWKYFGLANELMVRGHGVSADNLPLEKELTQFFSTLPLALFLQGRTKQNEMGVLRISVYDSTYKEFNVRKLSEFLCKRHDTLAATKVDEEMPEGKESIRVTAVIRGLEREISYEPTEGLAMIGKVNGVSEWNVFSSPTATFQRLQNFYNDAFVEIQLAPYIENWKITLIKQDIRGLAGFTRGLTYYLINGYTLRMQAHAATSQIVRFGSSMGLTKSVGQQGRAVKGMTELLFKNARFNETIPGIIPEIEILNDEYDPVKARLNIEKFLRVFKINKLLLPVGSPTVKSYLDYIEQEKILALFPITGATIFRDPKLRYLINMRGDYSMEGYLSTKYIIEKYGLSRFVLFYQDDAFGHSCIAGARKALEDAGIKEVLELAYQRNDVNFEQQVKQTIEYYPNAIALFSTTIASEGFIRDMGLENLTGKIFYGNSDLGEARFQNFIKNKGLKLITINTVPKATGSDLPIVKEFRRVIAQSGRPVPLDALTLEAYLGTTFLFEVMKKLKKDITAQKLVEFIERVKNYNHGGILLNFNPPTRELMSSMWIDNGDDKDWQEIKIPRDVVIPPYEGKR